MHGLNQIFQEVRRHLCGAAVAFSPPEGSRFVSFFQGFGFKKANKTNTTCKLGTARIKLTGDELPNCYGHWNGRQPGEKIKVRFSLVQKNTRQWLERPIFGWCTTCFHASKGQKHHPKNHPKPMCFGLKPAETIRFWIKKSSRPFACGSVWC